MIRVDVTHNSTALTQLVNSVNAERPHLLRRSLKEQDHDPPTFDDVHGTLAGFSANGVQHHLHLGTL